MNSEYLTVAGGASAEIMITKSRFIGTIQPVETEEAAQSFIQSMKTKYRDATHNVWAYRLRSGQKRYSDDGEPQGTAGIPSLDVLEKENIEDVAVVVTRYFGGTLLGAGGLVRAYSQGVKAALDAAGIVRMCACSVYDLEMPYELYGKLAYLFPQVGAEALSSDFLDIVRLQIILEDSQSQKFLKAVQEQTSAQVVPVLARQCYAPMNP